MIKVTVFWRIRYRNPTVAQNGSAGDKSHDLICIQIPKSGHHGLAMGLCHSHFGVHFVPVAYA